MRTIHKRMFPMVLVLATAVFVTGCSTPKNFYATGGSRADGTVDMAYDFRQFEKPVVNHQQAKSIAKSKCSVWGYRDAESFGGTTQNCYQRDGFGTCVAGQVLIKYQCLGNLDAVTPASSTPTGFAPAGAAPANGSMSQSQWQAMQLQQLMSEKGLSYEEYQRRYRLITGQQ